MKNIILQNLLRILPVFLLCGCILENKEPYTSYGGASAMQYSRPPQSSTAAPAQVPSAAPVRVSPDYYYAQPAYPQGYRGQQQNGYPRPASRSYNNPYSFQPAPQYPYYESDQYYVPPNYYGTPEGGPGGGLSPNNI